MITALYASLLAAILIKLTFGVIKQRRKNQVAYSDGGVDALVIARSAHGNATDTIPIFLILLGFFEMNGGPSVLIHLAGLIFITGRLVHAKAMVGKTFKGRVIGMHCTIWTLLALIALNILYLPIEKLW